MQKTYKNMNFKSEDFPLKFEYYVPVNSLFHIINIFYCHIINNKDSKIQSNRSGYSYVN